MTKASNLWYPLKTARQGKARQVHSWHMDLLDASVAMVRPHIFKGSVIEPRLPSRFSSRSVSKNTYVAYRMARQWLFVAGQVFQDFQSNSACPNPRAEKEPKAGLHQVPSIRSNYSLRHTSQVFSSSPSRRTHLTPWTMNCDTKC